MQPLQPECWHVAACRAALVLLPALDRSARSGFAGNPLFPWVCFGHQLCVSGWLQGVVTGFLCQPHPLSVHRSCLVVICTHNEQRRGAVNIEHLEICVKLMFYILMVSVFHYQWSAKALKERDCLPIPV